MLCNPFLSLSFHSQFSSCRVSLVLFVSDLVCDEKNLGEPSEIANNKFQNCYWLMKSISSRWYRYGRQRHSSPSSWPASILIHSVTLVPFVFLLNKGASEINFVGPKNPFNCPWIQQYQRSLIRSSNQCKNIKDFYFLTAIRDGRFGPGNGVFAITSMRCSGTERFLTACPHNSWTVDTPCTDGNTVSGGVQCNGMSC